MSLPKEPRQKMINMMYLVLTAMLALNVSAEILNAFKTVNTSIIKSNDVIKTKNNGTYAAMQQKMTTAETKELAAIWVPKAMQAQQLSKAIYDRLDSLKTQLINEAGPYTEDGVQKFREDDLDAATRLMDEHGEGKKLYNALIAYKQDLIGVLNPNNFSDPLNKKAAAQEQIDLTRQLPLNLDVPKSESGNTQTSDSSENWTTNYFHMTPAIAAMTILSKFQNDVKSSEAQFVDFCDKKIGEVAVRFDKTGVLYGGSATYLMPGDKLSMYAGVGAFSSASKPNVTIAGRQVPVDAEGKASLDIPVGGSGAQSVKVDVSYKDQNGIEQVEHKVYNYTVGTPSGVAISADKMNVLYVMGTTPNPLTISGGSGSEKVSATLTGGELKHISGSSWEAFPKTIGEQTINVTIDGKTTPKKFRVKYLPNPAAFVGSKSGGGMSSAEFKAIGGLIARLENSDFEAAFKVVSYKLGAVGGNIPQYQVYPVEGNRWSGSAEALIKRAGPGTSVFFDEIRVIGPDGRQREITPIYFNLK